jgi:hypothetical protein
MDFFCVVMMAKFFEQRVGLREGGDLLGGEDWRKAFLPEVVRALDLAFGLRGGSVAQRDLVKAQVLDRNCRVRKSGSDPSRVR